eukprot:11855604-Alexandrium_andersonii.AAC.1
MSPQCHPAAPANAAACGDGLPAAERSRRRHGGRPPGQAKKRPPCARASCERPAAHVQRPEPR